MALQTYTTLPVMKLYVGVNAESQADGLLTAAIEASSRDIDNRCDRYFGKDDSASDRVFTAKNGYLFIDDAVNDGAITVTDSNGNSITDFKVRPNNGIVRGQPWPAEYLTHWRFCAGEDFTVNATWGWPEVPDVVEEACKLLAAETYLSKDTPHGVKGIDEFGVVRIREFRQIGQKLSGVSKRLVTNLWR